MGVVAGQEPFDPALGHAQLLEQITKAVTHEDRDDLLRANGVTVEVERIKGHAGA